MMRRMAMVWSLAVAACAPDLREDFPFDGQVSDGPLVQVAEQPDGSLLALVDATSKGSRVYVDLDEGKELKADEAFETNAWDLAFQRYEVAMNGGGGNPTGQVKVAVRVGTAYESLTKAPADGYQQDASESVFNGVEGGWYYYDLGVHRLTTRPELLYVVKSSEGRYYKLQMLSYYDESGTPARLSLRYHELEAP